MFSSSLQPAASQNIFEMGVWVLCREQTRRRGLDTGNLDSHFQEPKANGPERQHHQRVFVFLQTRLSYL